MFITADSIIALIMLTSIAAKLYKFLESYCRWLLINPIFGALQGH